MSDSAIASLVALKTRLHIRISMVVIADQLPERHRAWADDLIPITALTANDASARVFKSVWSKRSPPPNDHKSV
ncbi:MAG: hypothetical protein HC853_03035 [Anaerolineae bacterium]|nr:hypothetical protein [Anaerolineae bacterium]